MSIPALKVIAEPRRQRILQLIWDRERTAGEIASDADVTFGAISQHLAVLHEAGLVDRRKEGRRRLYRAKREVLGPLAPFLEAMWSSRLQTLKGLAEWEERRLSHQRKKKS